jgi:hypothetical protein
VPTQPAPPTQLSFPIRPAEPSRGAGASGTSVDV